MKLIGYVRWTYAIAAWLLVAAIVVQFFLAGMGVFAPAEVGGFSLHVQFGRSVLFLMFPILVVLSFAARLPWRTTGLAAVLLGLRVLQSLLLGFYYIGGPALRPLASLHVINASLILLLALRVADRARELVLPVQRTVAVGGDTDRGASSSARV